MDRWARIVDHLLREVIGDGDISNLPGAGKPLPLDEDSHTPLDQRVAFKIMHDNEVVPEWMALANSLEASEARIRAEINSLDCELPAALADAAAGTAGCGGTKWSRYLNRLYERIKQHNSDVLLHNLKAPSGIPHKPLLAGDKLITQALAKNSRDA